MLNPEALNSYRPEVLKSCKHEMRCGDDDGNNGNDNKYADGNDGDEANNNGNGHDRFSHGRNDKIIVMILIDLFIVVIIMMVGAIVADTITNIITISSSSAQPLPLLWLPQSQL